MSVDNSLSPSPDVLSPRTASPNAQIAAINFYQNLIAYTQRLQREHPTTQTRLRFFNAEDAETFGPSIDSETRELELVPGGSWMGSRVVELVEAIGMYQGLVRVYAQGT